MCGAFGLKTVIPTFAFSYRIIGVSCVRYRYPRVVVLDHNELISTLPSQWSALQVLTTISLSHNALQGTLLSEIP